MKKIVKLFQFYHFRAFNYAFRFFFFYFYQKINPKGFLLINIYDYKMLIPMQYDGIGRALYVYRSRELDHKWMLDNELLAGNVVLDLGANIGYYAIMEARKIGGTGKIYAIEPDPRNIELLKKNIKLNEINNIFEFEQGAISNKDQKAEFTLSSKTNLSSFDYKKNKNNLNSITVQTYDLGNYLKSKKRVDLIRMDIEGHEIEVFDSLIKFSKNFQNHLPKKIIFETHFNVYKKKEYTRDTFEKLFEVGYKIKYFSSSNEPKEAFRKKGYYPFNIIKDYPFFRGIYKNINQKDFIDFAIETGGVRTVLLELKEE
jgi:FkbM family methyltransferase